MLTPLKPALFLGQVYPFIPLSYLQASASMSPRQVAICVSSLGAQLSPDLGDAAMAHVLPAVDSLEVPLLAGMFSSVAAALQQPPFPKQQQQSEAAESAPAPDSSSSSRSAVTRDFAAAVAQRSTEPGAMDSLPLAVLLPLPSALSAAGVSVSGEILSAYAACIQPQLPSLDADALFKVTDTLAAAGFVPQGADFVVEIGVQLRSHLPVAQPAQLVAALQLMRAAAPPGSGPEAEAAGGHSGGLGSLTHAAQLQLVGRLGALSGEQLASLMASLAALLPVAAGDDAASTSRPTSPNSGGNNPPSQSAPATSSGPAATAPLPNLLAELYDAALARLDSALPQAIAELLRSLASLQLTPSAQWLDAVLAACRKRIAEFSAADLSYCLYSTALMAPAALKTEVLSEACQALQPMLQARQVDGASLGRFMQALATAKYNPGKYRCRICSAFMSAVTKCTINPHCPDPLALMIMRTSFNLEVVFFRSPISSRPYLK